MTLLAAYADKQFGGSEIAGTVRDEGHLVPTVNL